MGGEVMASDLYHPVYPDVGELPKKQKVARASSARSRGLRMRLWALGVRECFWCGVPLRLEASTKGAEKATLEHIVPLSRGGTNDLVNLTLACGRCNSSRGTP